MERYYAPVPVSSDVGHCSLQISGKEQSFQDIMRYYRLQPQAQSHVYRSVLLSKVTPTDTHSQTSDDSTSSDRKSVHRPQPLCRGVIGS